MTSSRIIVVGNAGSGRTYFSAALSAQLGLPVVHLDDFYWMPGGYTRKRPSEGVAALVLKAAAQKRWIVERVFGELAEHFLPLAQQFIWLDFSWDDCRAALLARRPRNVAGLQAAEEAASFARLLEYAADYWKRTDGRSHAGHRRLFEAFNGAKVGLRNRQEMNDWLAVLTAH